MNVEIIKNLNGTPLLKSTCLRNLDIENKQRENPFGNTKSLRVYTVSIRKKMVTCCSNDCNNYNLFHSICLKGKESCHSLLGLSLQHFFLWIGAKWAVQSKKILGRVFLEMLRSKNRRKAGYKICCNLPILVSCTLVLALSRPVLSLEWWDM